MLSEIEHPEEIAEIKKSRTSGQSAAMASRRDLARVTKVSSRNPITPTAALIAKPRIEVLSSVTAPTSTPTRPSANNAELEVT